MKKLVDSKFLMILGISVIALILLVVGAFYLFSPDEEVFVKSGYVLNPLSANAERYFFNEGVGYHENLSSMVEFVDVDNNKAQVLKNSFLHYDDGSLSFLKKGAILDIDSISMGLAKFYNITSESIILKNKKEYYVDSLNGKITFNNFIGRISDDKYIVVGNAKLKYSGNPNAIEGDYFEIVYTEEGIVNIENKSVKYQIASEGAFIQIGDYVIDLGNKKITKGDTDIMSITAITIDGNENVEIMPKASSSTGTGSSGGNGSGSGTGGDGTGDGTGTGTGAGTGNGTGDGTGDGTGGAGENPGINVDDNNMTKISLKDAIVSATSVSVKFDIENKNDEDNYMLQVVNIDTGKTVDITAEVTPDAEINVNLLTPNSKYLFTVVNSETKEQYFQKIFKTNSFGIKLEKKYATDSSLMYSVIVGDNPDIMYAKLTLYKFNEETNQNEVVNSSYYDSELGEVVYVPKVYELKDFESGSVDVLFDGLDSNTIYTAVLDDFSLESGNFRDVYNIAVTNLTLKKTPVFSNLTVNRSQTEESFRLSIGDIIDEDNAITNYTYYIYEKENNNLAIDPISKNNASPISVKLGMGKNELKGEVNYYFKTVIEYFDNEKYIEYVTVNSSDFKMGSEPVITVVPDENKVTHEAIAGTIYLNDFSCMINIPDRVGCSGADTTRIEISKVNSITGVQTVVRSENVSFTVGESDIRYDFYFDGLEMGTTYYVNVYAKYNNGYDLDEVVLSHSDESKKTVTTKELSTFDVDWTDVGSSANHVVNLDAQLTGEFSPGIITPEESALHISKVVLYLYQGKVEENLSDVEPISIKEISGDEENTIKSLFYDNKYSVTTDGTFGLDIDALKALNEDGKLSEYYTIKMFAYYDNEGTKQINLNNNVIVYKISPVLLMEEIEEPTINIEYITNKASGYLFDKLGDNGTHVGYRITAAFDKNGLLANSITPQKITFRVFDSGNNQVRFYVKDKSGNLSLVDSVEYDNITDNYYETEIYMDYGIDYYDNDLIMRRGGVYTIGYVIDAVSDGVNVKYPTVTKPGMPSDYGVYGDDRDSSPSKESPNFRMYPSTSSMDSVTYKYFISDPDCALYKEEGESKYYSYYRINYSYEQKQEITMVDVDKREFAGSLTYNAMQNDIYSIYYKKNVSKTGDITNDIVDYLDEDVSGFRFEGKYDALALDEDGELKYNFKYEVINNPLTDNKVTIKMLMDKNLLNKVLSYKVSFSDEKGNKLDLDVHNLSSCDPSDLTLTENRCINVDYITLKEKGMNSVGSNTNNITVTVSAIYDNGLIGFDMTSDSGYYIFQENVTVSSNGSYISTNSSGIPLLWTPDKDIKGKGYYTYTKEVDSSTGLISSVKLKNKIYNNKETQKIPLTLSSVGYVSKYGVMNLKMVSIDEMVGINNVFSFSSITPKIQVTNKTQLIDGVVASIVPTGMDTSDLKNEGSEDDPQYYFYVEVWDSIDEVGNLDNKLQVRPRIRVNINDLDNVRIDKLLPNSTYYYKVYAYMYKNGVSTYTELFSSNYLNEYKTETYSFLTLGAEAIFQSYKNEIVMDKNIYGNRSISTNINLIAYKNSESFDYSIFYYMCKTDSEICMRNDTTSEDIVVNNLFENSIPMDELKTSNSREIDISSLNLEFGTDYKMYIYADIDVYDIGEDGEYYIRKHNLLLNGISLTTRLRALTEPSFVVTREAKIVDGEYVIDFKVVVNDPDKTLVNGEYFVKLTEGGNLIGTIQELTEDGYTDISLGSIEDYSKYPFDASVTNKSIRIKGLSEESKYTVTVSGRAYVNNYSSDVPVEDRTFDVVKSHTVYSSNQYGIALGKDLTFSATEKSIIVTFLGGSSFENIKKVHYTIGLYDEEDTNTTSGTYVIGENGKYFEIYNRENWRFVINPDGMQNILGKTYVVALSFEVQLTNMEEPVILTSDLYSGKAEYVIDEKDK